ncbi:MAG TPA: tetratricopeptide repeat protein [Terracidiphilus sp.]|nr:tetratricopeptide repeat protein [Terracidiphilus sp.]
MTTMPSDLRQQRGRLSELALRYQSVLAQQPDSLQALVGMCVVAMASGQREAAVEMAAAAVRAAPDASLAWTALGQALTAASRFEDAERAYAQALTIDAASPLALLGLGELKTAAGHSPENFNEAIAYFKQALARRPAWAAAHLGLGNAYARSGRDAEALASCARASELAPRSAEAHFAAGFVLARLKRTREAEARYRRALFLRPDFAAAWLNLGVLLREAGRDRDAEAALRRAAQLRPELVSAWLNLALVERDRGRLDTARKHLERAFELNPVQKETLIARCQLCAAERNLPGAWRWLRRAQAVDPDCDEAHNMEGILLHHEGRFEEAVAAFERAEALGHRAAASNRGNSLLELGRTQEALRAHELAVEREPESPGARYNLALTQLRAGDWKNGWAACEARWSFREVHRRPRRLAVPRWQGEALYGERVLLHAEQGLGDTIQFCRYAALVAARGGVPVLAVQEPVERLLRSLAAVRAGTAEVVSLGRAIAGRDVDFDCECPLMSLPAVFGTTVDTVPLTDSSSGAYLGADADEVAARRCALPSLRAGMRIGIAWAGNPRYKADAQRSMKLATMLPLLRAVPADWISLQKGEAAAQIAGIPAGIGLRDGSSSDRDLAETAALIATLDLVITTDTSIAHLAGAMGKPVWILLPHIADWRWMEGLETTPWYPAARLFRQQARADWSGVFARVIAELRRSDFLARQRLNSSRRFEICPHTPHDAEVVSKIVDRIEHA